MGNSKNVSVGIVFKAATGGALRNIDRLQNRTRKLSSGISATASAITAALTGAVTQKAVKAYGDIADAQGEIASLDISDKGIRSITASAMKFSDYWSGTGTDKFVAASYDIKSGISSLGDTAVGEFTRIAALTGKATKSSTAEMTDLFATGYGIYRRQFDAFGRATIKGWNGLSEEERDIKFGQYFSAGISAAVQRFKTNGPAMSAAMSNLGATATAANVSFEEQLAVLGQLQATMPGPEAATKYRAFINSAYGAGEKLGLQFTDMNGRLKSMPEILKQVAMAYGTTLDAAESEELKKAFGTEEAVGVIKLLLPQIDALKSDTNALHKDLQGGMEKTRKMAEAMNKGPNKAFERLSQQTTNLAATVGERLSPRIESVTAKVGAFAIQLRRTISEHPELIDQAATLALQIGGVAAGALVLKGALWMLSPVFTIARIGVMAYGVAVTTAKVAMWSLRMGLVATKAVFLGIRSAAIAGTLALNLAASGSWAARAAMTALSVAGKVTSSVMWLVNAAMAASPVGLVVAGVAALAYGAYQVYKNWKPIKAWFVGIWDAVGEKIAWVTSKIESVSGYVSKVSGFFGFGGEEEKKSPVSSVVPKAVTSEAANNVSYKGPTAKVSEPSGGGSLSDMFGSLFKGMTGPSGAAPVSLPSGEKVREPMVLPQPANQVSAAPLDVTITFGDIIVQGSDGKIDAEDLKNQVEPIILRTVRQVLAEEQERRLKYGAAS